VKKTYPYSTIISRASSWERIVICTMIVSLLSIVLFTSKVYADTLNVTATVPGPIPTSPAVITSPIDQTTFDTQEITVKGTCPPEGAYIILSRNNVSAGTAPCSGGTFEIVINLILGTNELQALVYNITNDPGPASTVVTVHYLPSQPPTVPVQPLPVLQLPAPPISPSPIAPFTLEYNYKYQVRNEGELWQWDIIAQGGTPPYKLIVDWNDGTQDTYGPAVSHSFPLKHTYKKAGTYTPLVHGVDQLGARATLQLLAVVNPREVEEASATTKSASASDDAISSYVIVGAPLGAVFVAALIHAFVVQGKLPKLPRFPKKLK